jgi:hypothetical protein
MAPGAVALEFMWSINLFSNVANLEINNIILAFISLLL